MEAYLTLVSTDSYAPGAMVLARRLIDLHTSKSLACLVTPNVSDRVRQLLQECQYNVIQVDPIYTTRPDNLVLLGRPDLAATLTKINLWRLKQYKKVVFLDADTFPLRSIDELFDRPSFAAAPDIGWPDCFNSGVFVAEPSEQIFNALVHMAAEKGSFDGGDQGLLNSYFHNWPETNEHRLPFLYNTTPSAAYSYVPAFLEFKHKIAVVHFIGKDKPWNAQRFADGSIFHPRGPAVELVQQWWDTWDKFYGKDVLPANLMAPMVPAGKDTPPSLPDDLSYSYQAAAPSKWLEFATPDSTTNWDMKELQKDVDRITARMHILKHNGQLEKTETPLSHSVRERLPPKQKFQMKPPSEASHASSSPHIVSTKDMSSGKWGSRTPSPSWDNCPATQRSHHPWDRDHRKGTEHPIGRFSSMSAGPSSPWESPGIPHLTVSPPEEYCEDPKKSRADSVAAATITQCVSSVWDDMGRYSFDFPNRPKKNSTLPSQEITPSVWDDLARPRKMAFSWDDDIASVGSAGTRRKAHPKQDGQQAPEGELALDVIHSREPLENLAITGGIATRRSSRVSGETDIGTRGGQVTMQAARDMLDRPRAASPQASSRDIPSTGRRLSVSSSWNAVHPSSILPSTLSSKVDQPDLTNPSLPMFTTRRMSAGPSQYIFLDDSAVAEATKLEFELNHQDKSAE